MSAQAWPACSGDVSQCVCRACCVKRGGAASTVHSLAPWSTADESTRRHLALVRARWDLRMARAALELAERFRREALEALSAAPSAAAEDAVTQAQVLVQQCREDAQAAVAVAQEVTDLVLREEATDTHTAFVAGVAHAHQA